MIRDSVDPIARRFRQRRMAPGRGQGHRRENRQFLDRLGLGMIVFFRMMPKTARVSQEDPTTELRRPRQEGLILTALTTDSRCRRPLHRPSAGPLLRRFTAGGTRAGLSSPARAGE